MPLIPILSPPLLAGNEVSDSAGQVVRVINGFCTQLLPTYARNGEAPIIKSPSEGSLLNVDSFDLVEFQRRSRTEDQGTNHLDLVVINDETEHPPAEKIDPRKEQQENAHD